jgi:hypothetical protein
MFMPLYPINEKQGFSYASCQLMSSGKYLSFIQYS